MICINCGKELEAGTVFCPSCGTRAVQPAVQPVEQPVVQPAAEERPMYGMECTQNDRTGAVQYRVPAQTGSTEAEYKAPPPAAADVREKEYFGRGALALCLVVIGLLAASTGVFAYLYFSMAGVL